MREARLEISGLSHRYADGTAALRDVELAVPGGQFCVLLGPSGSGKSSLLRAINGLLPFQHGRIRLGGQSLRPGQTRDRRRQVATIHQGIDLVPRLSVLDNVLCGALGEMNVLDALLGNQGEARRVRACALLASVGLQPSHLYRRASELSGGQQQRVGIARAFIGMPRLVLADEPVASLDPSNSRDVLGMLRRAAADHGATVLCSLHQIDLALTYADRIVGLRDGRVVLDCIAARFDHTHRDALYAANAQASTSEVAA
ncbi:MAG: phosphonate ABC transporter ATP-binding protein [Steroidobacteraceae bacterium]